MTPLQIAMMLHYYAVAEPYAMREPCHANSSAVSEQRSYLVAAGMLEVVCDNEAGYRVTEKGRAYIQHLTEVEEPVAAWIRPSELAEPRSQITQTSET